MIYAMKFFYLCIPFLLFFYPVQIHAQETFLNPIISGSFPDPSICRVGDDFYIVNSSFEYFPGLPIHHSRDLVSWELIGYALNHKNISKSLINLHDVQQEGGIHAPSIRYNDGVFYIITTNVYSPTDTSKDAIMLNFVVTSKDPKGPWSLPHIIEGAPGIDPDIFFDDNGKVWFVGTHALGDKDKNGIGEIWTQELDIKNWKLKGGRYSIWTGACGGCCVEGPHMYKKNGKYYLMVAEGGTSLNHAVMIAVSSSPSGPFDSNPRNPILTSRHLSNSNWVNSTGHADLVELRDGRWFMVSLGIRNEFNGKSNMGRETFLMPVEWEEATSRWVQNDIGDWEPLIHEWPVVAPLSGKVERNNDMIFDSSIQNRKHYFYDDFDSKKLNVNWNFRRIPSNNTYSLNSKKGFLRLYLQSESFSQRKRYSLIGIRQKETFFEFSAKMNFSPNTNGEEAGLSLFQKDNNYLKYTVLKSGGDVFLSLSSTLGFEDVKVLNQQLISDFDGQVVLKISSVGSEYNFKYSMNNGKSFKVFFKTQNNIHLSQGYTGSYLGVYGSSNGKASRSYADFDWCKYSNILED